MEKGYDLVAIGEILVAMLEIGKNKQGNSIFAANPGEGPAGVAAAAARLGASAAYIGKVGNDPLGQSLYEMLRWSGVDVSHVTTDPEEPTTLALVPSYTEDGLSSYVRCPGADVRLSEAELSHEMIESARFFHFGSESLCDEPARSATFSAVQTARRAGVPVSFAPGCRVPQYPEREGAEDDLQKALGLCDLLCVSSEEMERLTGTAQLEEGSARLLEQGPFLVLVTMGRNGVFYRRRAVNGEEITGYIPAPQMSESYTGDVFETFIGAFLTRLLEVQPEKLCEIGKSALEEYLRFAVTAGSLTASRLGTIRAMPIKEEVAEKLGHS